MSEKDDPKISEIAESIKKATETKRVIVTGAGGTGKSRLIGALLEREEPYLPYRRPEPDSRLIYDYYNILLTSKDLPSFPVSWPKEQFKHSPAVAAVAKTIWTLWKDAPAHIWEIIASWSNGPEVLASTCNVVIKTGLEKGYLTIGQIIEKIEDWLKEQDQPAAPIKNYEEPIAFLLEAVLPEISKEDLTKLATKYSKDRSRSLQGFTSALRQLFYKNPSRAVRTLQQLSQYDKSITGNIIEGIFQHVAIPDNESQEFYRLLERQLLAVKFLTPGSTSRTIPKLIKKARDKRSQIMNVSTYKDKYSKNFSRSPKSKRRR